MAVPVIIVGYMCLGIGIFWTLVLHAQYLYHDLTNGFMGRTRETTADILTIGPFGQAAGALQLLGTAAQKDFGQYQRGTFLQSMAGSGVAAASTLIALMLLGFSFMLACIVFCYLLENSKNWKFQLTWWTLIFPVGIFLPCSTSSHSYIIYVKFNLVSSRLTLGVNALALVSISTGLDSPASRAVATAVTIFLVISWLVLAPLTIWNLRTMWKIPQNWHEA